MHPFLSHKIFGQTFLLSAQRTIFWEEEKTLILSDLHLGKSGHFRKSGIAIPQNLYKEDLFRLLNEIQFFRPKQLIIVGDLFLCFFKLCRDSGTCCDPRNTHGAECGSQSGSVAIYQILCR